MKLFLTFELINTSPSNENAERVAHSTSGLPRLSGWRSRFRSLLTCVLSIAILSDVHAGIVSVPAGRAFVYEIESITGERISITGELLDITTLFTLSAFDGIAAAEVEYEPHIAFYLEGTLAPFDGIAFALMSNVIPMADGGTLHGFASVEVVPRAGENSADVLVGGTLLYGRDPAPFDGVAELDLLTASGLGMPELMQPAPGTASGTAGPLGFPATAPGDPFDVLGLEGTIEPLFGGVGGHFKLFVMLCAELAGGEPCEDPIAKRSELQAAAAALVPLPTSVFLLPGALAMLGLSSVIGGSKRRAGA